MRCLFARSSGVLVASKSNGITPVIKGITPTWLLWSTTVKVRSFALKSTSSKMLQWGQNCQLSFVGHICPRHPRAIEVHRELAAEVDRSNQK
jgi:hypothetical protein